MSLVLLFSFLSLFWLRMSVHFHIHAEGHHDHSVRHFQSILLMGAAGFLLRSRVTCLKTRQLLWRENFATERRHGKMLLEGKWSGKTQYVSIKASLLALGHLISLVCNGATGECLKKKKSFLVSDSVKHHGLIILGLKNLKPASSALFQKNQTTNLS